MDGAPVVTLAEQRYVERISASKLSAVGLSDLITRSPEEYVDKAIALANDVEWRTDLRSGLRDVMAKSPLCDPKGLAREIESAYEFMWEKHLRKSD